MPFICTTRHKLIRFRVLCQKKSRKCGEDENQEFGGATGRRDTSRVPCAHDSHAGTIQKLKNIYPVAIESHYFKSRLFDPLQLECSAVDFMHQVYQGSSAFVPLRHKGQLLSASEAPLRHSLLKVSLKDKAQWNGTRSRCNKWKGKVMVPLSGVKGRSEEKTVSHLHAPLPSGGTMKG